QFAERPAGVVVRRFLRIVGTPVLMVEERIGDAGIGLVHADDVGSGRKFTRGRDGCGVFYFGALPRRAFCRFLRRERDGKRGGGARDFHLLLFEHLQQSRLEAGARVVRREHVGRRAFGRGLGDRALGLQIKILEKQGLVALEIEERSEEAGFLIVVVVALGPGSLGQRRILAEPSAGVLV